MDPGFRYWIAKNHVDAVSILFDAEDKGHMFSVDVDEATQEFPDDTLDRAIYKVSMRAFRKESVS